MIACSRTGYFKFKIELQRSACVPSSRVATFVKSLSISLLFLLSSCFDNNPHPARESGLNIFYDTFNEEPKKLDPANSYSSNEYAFLQQIYEPVVQYHFLKRPYELVPLTAEKVPVPEYFDAQGKTLPEDTADDQIAKVRYTINLKSGILYEPHPCFAQDEHGKYIYHLENGVHFGRRLDHPNQLEHKGTRTLTAADYVYQIKRLADPRLQCPIASLLSTYLDGFENYHERLSGELTKMRSERRKKGGIFYNQERDEKENPLFIDLRKLEMDGVRIIDALTYQIDLKKKYPQFVYWLAMPFFAPMPWEGDRFFAQSACAERDFTINRFPVGTGPFALTENRPNFRMTLTRNPNYHGDAYPSEGTAEDKAAGLLDDAGKKLPFLDAAVYVLEKESIPRWNKFLQGYYDTSGIQSDVFDQAVKMGADGASLSDELREKGIYLNTEISPLVYYYAFNMLDETVGGYTPDKQKLRQAISIAVDIEEYIQIFANGRAEAASSPLPPGIPGYRSGKDGINHYVYDWDELRNLPRRKDIAVAQKLLTEAGYPKGRNATTGQPLVIYFDTVSGGSGDKAFLDWIRKQFNKLNIDLQIRATDYNQFQEKANKGNWQFLQWGWHADYPDPENFLFLLNGTQGKVRYQGENAANYDNPEYNELFKKMENMENGPARMELLDRMLALIRKDAPWIWGYYPKGYGLYHSWYKNAKPMSIGGNTLKYKRIDTEIREAKRTEWNKPIVWPILVLVFLILLGTIPAALHLYRSERRIPRR